MTKKNFLTGVCLFWDNDGYLVFTNFSFSNIGTKKQIAATRKLGNEIVKKVSEETERINKIK